MHSTATTSTGAPGISAPPWQLRTRTSPRALELAGERVFHRGGTQAADEFLVRASELTPDPVRKVDRLLATVRLRAAEGDAARAQPLLDAVLTRVHDGRQRAEAEWTQGLIWLEEGRGRDALHAFARGVASIEEYDSGFALDALITAEDAAIYAGSLRDDALVDAIASTALRLLPEGDSATPAELLVGGIAVRLTDGYAASAPMLRSALAGLRQQVERSRRDRDPERTRASQRTAPPRRERGRCPPRRRSAGSGDAVLGRLRPPHTNADDVADRARHEERRGDPRRALPGRGVGDRRGRRDPLPRRFTRPYRRPGGRRAAPPRVPG